MKLKFAMIAAICAVFVATPLFAKELKSVTGLNWMQMYADERLSRIQEAMAVLKKDKIKLSRPAEEYCQEVYTLVLRDISLYPVPVTRILAGYVHDSEPEMGAAIEALISAEKI